MPKGRKTSFPICLKGVQMNKTTAKTLFLLHVLLGVYSLSEVFAKLASKQSFLSFSFILFYGLVIAMLGIYAIGWQKVIKRMPLTTAYANKAVTVIWGCFWGVVLFQETLSLQKILGICIVIAGVILFEIASQEEAHE